MAVWQRSACRCSLALTRIPSTSTTFPSCRRMTSIVHALRDHATSSINACPGKPPWWWQWYLLRCSCWQCWALLSKAGTKDVLRLRQLVQRLTSPLRMWTDLICLRTHYTTTTSLTTPCAWHLKLTTAGNTLRMWIFGLWMTCQTIISSGL